MCVGGEEADLIGDRWGEFWRGLVMVVVEVSEQWNVEFLYSVAVFLAFVGALYFCHK